MQRLKARDRCVTREPKVPKPSTSANARLYGLAAFLAFWFVVICIRLVWLQVFSYGEFTRQASRQQQQSIEVSAARGNIYDRHGNSLAMSVSVDSIFAVPSPLPAIHTPPLIPSNR